jgi:hypothetical protein
MRARLSSVLRSPGLHVMVQWWCAGRRQHHRLRLTPPPAATPHCHAHTQMHLTVLREVNVGMGHVDQHMYPPTSSVYPVDALYLSLLAQHQPQPLDTKTTHRCSFPWPAAAAPTGDALLQR